MDLYAYGNISNLAEIAEKNGIEIPRLRGYRLMSEQEPITEAEIREMCKEEAVRTAENLCRSHPFWNPHAYCYRFCPSADDLCNYYLIPNKEENLVYEGINWDRIHGKKRKILKFEIKKAAKRIRKEIEVWNKYCGQTDVLYIHSRMGGYNWECFGGKEEILNAPWFLDRVDDSFDGTYCSFYAKIKE